jgi:hypothetical protein
MTIGTCISASAAPPAEDPDWPCQQRLVPELTAGAYWTGVPIPDKVDWRADPRVAKLVEEVAPRDVPTETGVAEIQAFVKTAEPNVLPAAFAGILEETNRQRDQLIARLKELMRRQREIAAKVGKATDEASSIPADATGDDAARRADALNRQAFLTRTFDETRHTMRYACEAPTALDARLGAYARALQPAP